MAAPYVDEDGVFSAPPVVRSLDDLPFDYREMYETRADQPGKWFLSRAGRELHDWFATELATIKAKRDEVIRNGDAELAKLRAEGVDAKIDSAIRQALVRSSTKSGLHKAATALLRESHTFEVEGADDGEGHVVLVATKFGLHSVDAVVEDWLASDGGAEFRGKTSAPTEGHFANIISALRQSR